MRQLLRPVLASALLLGAAAPLPLCWALPETPAPKEITLYALAEVHGFPEPCGCTANPLGDVARVAALVRAGAGQALLLDAGGLRHDEGPIAPTKQAEARLKAAFLERTFAGLPAPGAVVGLQPEDLVDGAAALRGTQRLAANLKVPGLALLPALIRNVGGVRVGVLGIADPAGAWPKGSTSEEPRAAAMRAAASLRKDGAELVVALTGLRRPAARRLADSVPGLDVVVVGDDVGDGVADAEQVGAALLVVPGKEAQRVVRIRFQLGPKGKPVTRWFPGPEWQKRKVERLTTQVQRLSERLGELRRTRDADPAFVRRTEDEHGVFQQELAAARRPLAPPNGGYVTADLLPVRRTLPRDAEVARQMAALDRLIGDENVKAGKGPPPPPALGQAAYVGNVGCKGTCHQHDEAHDMWLGTVHEGAWRTLLQAGKQYSYDCVHCHTTGFDALGGANLWTLSALERPASRRGAPPVDLRAVGCEVCHGPGSLHARAPSKNPIPVPRPQKERCLDCHTKDHSDTFEPAAYLRDILGPGHGEEARKLLGPGPTGAALRRAAKQGH